MHGFVAFGCVLRVTTVLLVVSGFASVVLGQHSSGGCPSEVRVPAGSSTVVDCVPGADFRGKRYRWTSPDPSWLEYLSDAAAASPRFHAPVDAEMPYHVAYRRLVFDEEGAVVDRGLVSIIVHHAEVGGAKRSRASEVPAGMGAEVGELAAAYESVPVVYIQIDQDTSFSVTVRVFDATRVEEEFTVKVRNTSGPMELRIECDPLQREVYEGAPAFRITCKTISGPTAELSWTWSAEGETPIEALELDLTENDFRTATFHVPAHNIHLNSIFRNSLTNLGLSCPLYVPYKKAHCLFLRILTE